MQYPVPPHVDPQDPESERWLWRLANIGPNHPRFKHLPVVVGRVDGTIEVVRGEDDVSFLPADHPERQRLFDVDNVGKKHFVVRNRLGYIRLVRCGARTPVGFIELHLYSAPLELKESIGAARTMEDLIALWMRRLCACASLPLTAGRCSATRQREFKFWWTRVDRMRTSPRLTCPDRLQLQRPCPHRRAGDALLPLCVGVRGRSLTKLSSARARLGQGGCSDPSGF